ncbi:MAG: UDP-N-acetylmuramoyl-L-alanine--D-glutamate ligase [Desulfotomaculaceae bacterium]|nr:UDP-N-acetylmuramoyl-L-alanine--D-glutamate ligase [Desulfotomaculaceae bacterium]
MELKGKKILVVGAGKSGLAVAHFLAGKGACAVLTDAKVPVYPGGEMDQLEEKGVVLALDGYPAVGREAFDMVVMSPGVPLTEEPARAARANGITLIGELELAYSFARAPLVAITGTNGKTTTTTLLGEIFKKSGLDTLVGGNIGLPLVTEVERYGPDSIIVAEVSSFQLETVISFKPGVAVILNITQDHLDRHGDMAGYMGAKSRIFANQDPGDFTVLNYDDPLTAGLGEKTNGRTVFFSRHHELGSGVFVKSGEIVAKTGEHADVLCGIKEIGIPGAHNLENALAAAAAAQAAGISSDTIAGVLKEFKGVPHRLEFVAEINGVKYINDSKGTNPDASIKALQAYCEPVVLIAGGKNKGSDFGAFAGAIKERARALVVLGQSADLIAAAARARGFTNIQKAADFTEAVILAHRSARPGEIVLLSPACASWDMFKSFEERGDLFKKIVFNLKRSSCQ